MIGASDAVALGYPRLGALVTGRTDPVGRLELDQFLQHQTNRVPDQIDAVTGSKRAE